MKEKSVEIRIEEIKITEITIVKWKGAWCLGIHSTMGAIANNVLFRNVCLKCCSAIFDKNVLQIWLFLSTLYIDLSCCSGYAANSNGVQTTAA